MDMVGWILIIAVVVVIIVVAGVSYHSLCIALKPHLWQTNEAIEREKSLGNWGDYDKYDKESFLIKSFDGYELHSILIKNSGNKFVIITHGHTSTKYASVKYANIFYKLGFNVLIYDLRHHGENKRCFCSMGNLESKDIIAVADYLRGRFGEDIEIGLQGESLGASSSLMALGLDDRFSFCVEDCGFSDLHNLIQFQMKVKYNLPKFILYTAELLAIILYKDDIRKIKPIESVKRTSTPILFIHGGADKYIPFDMCSDMYDVCGSKKEIVMFEGAGHAQSYQTNPEKYFNTVLDFIKSVDKVIN